MILKTFDFLWKEDTNLNIVLDVYDKKITAIIKFSTLMNHFKISNTSLLSQDKESIDNNKLEQTVKLFEEKLKGKIQDIMLFVDSNNSKISNNLEITLSPMDLDIIFKQNKEKENKIIGAKKINDKNKKSNIGSPLLKYFFIPIIFVIIQFGISLYLNKIGIMGNGIEIFKDIEVFNIEIFSVLFFVFIYYILFIQNIKIKEHLNEFIPVWLSITFIYFTFDRGLEYLNLFIICITSFYFSFLLRARYKTNILFYSFIVIGIIYNPIFRMDIEPDDFGKILLLLPFILYRLLYLGKHKDIEVNKDV